MCLLNLAVNRAFMLIESTESCLPQGLEEPISGIIDPAILAVTLRNYFLYNPKSDIKPAIKITDTEKMIAVPFDQDSLPDFELIGILRQMEIPAKESHWDGDYESYYIALRKYPYIKWCIDNQQWEKLMKYLFQAA